MKRRTLIQYEDASPEVQAIYDEIMRVTGSTTVPNIFKVFGNNGKVLKATWSKLRYTLIEGEVPLLLKQLILFVASVQAGNEYCAALHGNAALKLDRSLSCDDLSALAEGRAYDGLPRSFKVAIDVVTQAAREPKSVQADNFNFEERLGDAGFSESEIDELVAQADFGSMMNMITSIFDVPPEQPFPPPDR